MPPSAALGLLCLAASRGAAAQEWQCDAPPGKNCQVRLGPTAEQSWEEWLLDYDTWKARGQQFFDFSAYDNVGVQWAYTSFVQPQVRAAAPRRLSAHLLALLLLSPALLPQAMLHDRYLFDRETNAWTVDRYLDDVEERYGGIDSVLVWQFYPNSGVDDRNNFDMIENLPGGMAGVQRMVAAFQERGVKVLWACFPWDHGTRNTGRAEYVDLVEIVIESGADGINVRATKPHHTSRLLPIR